MKGNRPEQEQSAMTRGREWGRPLLRRASSHGRGKTRKGTWKWDAWAGEASKRGIEGPEPRPS